MNAHQLQHALASVSDKALSKDGWTDMDQRDLPPELNQTLDMSLLEPPEKIPDGNVSSVAVMNYVVRALQNMICETSMFKHQLMWDPKVRSWRLVFACLPGFRDTPLTFFNVTWKQNDQAKWRTLNSPTVLFKDLRSRKPHTESVRI